MIMGDRKVVKTLIVDDFPKNTLKITCRFKYKKILRVLLYHNCT